jgi:hypothetical protein
MWDCGRQGRRTKSGGWTHEGKEDGLQSGVKTEWLGMGQFGDEGMAERRGEGEREDGARAKNGNR